MADAEIKRLGPADVALAVQTFALMAVVFDEGSGELSDTYVAGLLANAAFWAFAAAVDGKPVGGLTAHTLPMTRAQAREVLLYDIAVAPEVQRQGIGRQLVAALRDQAAQMGITSVWVLADDEDTHAIDFYRALRGVPSSVTAFNFGPPH